MSTILVLNENILAVDPIDKGDYWLSNDIVIPKTVCQGAIVYTVTLPDDYAPNKYTYDGTKFILIPMPPVYLTFDELNDDTQKRLDDFAKTKGYSDIVSACTYASSANLQYKSDADYCLLSRDATWEQLYLIFAEINQGTRPMPTDYDQIAVDLPVLAWPVI